METKLFNCEGQEIGEVKLTDRIFNQNINKHLLWEAVTILLRNQRKGLAKTKTRAEVRGGGRKPWRQKGIGWARAGSTRSPIWKGGGVAFGPSPRDYTTQIPFKKRMKALVSSLSDKAKEQKILVIEDLKVSLPKTKYLVNIIKNIKLENNKILIGVSEMEKNLKLASRNLPLVNLKKVQDINSLDILSCDYLIVTKRGLEILEQRCAVKK